MFDKTTCRERAGLSDAMNAHYCKVFQVFKPFNNQHTTRPKRMIKSRCNVSDFDSRPASKRRLF